MKLFYSTLFLLFILTADFAQRTVNLQLVASKLTLNPATTSYQSFVSGDTLYYNGSTKYYFEYEVKNLGPDSLIPGDTIYLKNTDKQIYTRQASMVLSPGQFLKKDSTILMIPLDLIGNTWVTWRVLPPPVFPQTLPTVWIDSIWVRAGSSNTTITDPNLLDDVVTTPILALMTFPASVSDIESIEGLHIYPNPSGGVFNIEFDAGNTVKNANVMVKDMMGKIVYEQTLHDLAGPQHHTINASGLPAGIYVVDLDRNGQKTVSKVSIR